MVTVIISCVVPDGRFPLTIGENQLRISIQSVILTLEHDRNAPNFRGLGAPVSLGDRVYLGTRAVVLLGVSIGEMLLAAGAGGYEGCPSAVIVGGVPVCLIGARLGIFDRIKRTSLELCT